MMRRRHFITGVGALIAIPAVVLAQQARKQHRVALILTTSHISEMAGPDPVHPGTRAFLRELRTLGYIEGQNIVIERRSAEGQFDRFPSIVGELVRLNVDVIVSAGANSHYRQVKDAANAIPIVMLASQEPDKAGLVASLARPGGNVTGLTIDISPEIEAKRLELLKEAIPGIRRVAYLGTKAAWDSPPAKELRRAAPLFGVELKHVEHTPTDYTTAFAAIERQRPDAIFASFSAETFAHRRTIAEFALKARLAGVFPYQEITEAGGLMSYGMSVPDLFRRSAHYVDKILRGANPGDLPVERPTKFDLVINRKTADELGLSIPQSVLLRADRVIE
jgi:putative tryptophan/tyrosine transport system substrate-binding protein